MIDLRSDTVTHPTPAMRRAMASAEVGDDVYGEDPTIRRLEERAASLLGREAAVFVPSGTMGNQIAVHLHTIPGSEVIGEVRTHIFNFEMGAMAALSGALPRPIQTDDGILAPEQVERAIQPKSLYRTPTRLLILENTLNLACGRVIPPARMHELVGVAKTHGIAVHLDGARIHNAAAAAGVSAAELARGCDTVMFCLSKGLAAPVGSVLAGDADTIREARRIRKLFGGGMRQAGILAAAGLVALDEMLPRLAEDHATARRLAELVAEAPHVDLDPGAVQTNIVFFRIEEEAPLRAPEAVARLRERGILANALGPDRIRMVTHYEISARDVDIAGRAMQEVMAA
ncbi:MAG: aminotransferase class I/II-fold pyridoxal phosphate-dependent enzyme [Acidobacteria bacterium]|nr:aminotransferase class I/II-fold pyridoxal phosphate-dependent enzyme [Acidobacteriota bacterium]